MNRKAKELAAAESKPGNSLIVEAMGHAASILPGLQTYEPATLTTVTGTELKIIPHVSVRAQEFFVAKNQSGNGPIDFEAVVITVIRGIGLESVFVYLRNFGQEDPDGSFLVRFYDVSGHGRDPKAWAPPPTEALEIALRMDAGTADAQ